LELRHSDIACYQEMRQTVHHAVRLHTALSKASVTNKSHVLLQSPTLAEPNLDHDTVHPDLSSSWLSLVISDYAGTVS